MSSRIVRVFLISALLALSATPAVTSAQEVSSERLLEIWRTYQQAGNEGGQAAADVYLLSLPSHEYEAFIDAMGQVTFVLESQTLTEAPHLQVEQDSEVSTAACYTFTESILAESFLFQDNLFRYFQQLDWCTAYVDAYTSVISSHWCSTYANLYSFGWRYEGDIEHCAAVSGGDGYSWVTVRSTGEFAFGAAGFDLQILNPWISITGDAWGGVSSSEGGI